LSPPHLKRWLKPESKVSGFFFGVCAIAADPLESRALPHDYPYAMIRVMVDSSAHHSSQFRGWNE
jgi:hypothetical protein